MGNTRPVSLAAMASRAGATGGPARPNRLMHPVSRDAPQAGEDHPALFVRLAKTNQETQILTGWSLINILLCKIPRSQLRGWPIL